MDFKNFLGSSYTDEAPNVECEEAINVYLQTIESGNGENPYAMYRSPGITQRFADPANAYPVPGMLGLNGSIWCAIGVTIYKFSWDGGNLVTSATYGPIVSSLTGIGFVASPTQIGIYSSGHAYCITIATGAFVEITWPGIAVAGIGFLNQYLLLLSSAGDGFFYSEPGDFNSGDPLNFRSAEASATKYISLTVHQEQAWLHGNGPTTQVFYNDANNADEPFQPNLQAVIPQGTAAAASPISIPGANRLFWIDEAGIARGSNGYVGERVSNHAIENQWRTYGNISDAVSHTVTWNGNIMWRVWFPAADMTWEYNTAMPPGKGWVKVLGWNSTTGTHTAHRGMSSCQQFGRQFMGDRSNGKIYTLSPDDYSDDHTPIVWLRRAPVINNEGNRIEFPFFGLQMQTGLGDGSNGDPTLGDVTPEYDPQIMIRYSNDWGQNWSNELMRSLGKQGEFNKRVYVNRCGAAYQRAFEVSGSAMVGPIAILACLLQDPEGLNS